MFNIFKKNNKQQIQVYIPKTGSLRVVNRDYQRLIIQQIEQIGSGYRDRDCWLGDSERIEITKDGFKVITDKTNEILYKIIK